LFVVAVRGRQRAAESSVLALPASPEPAFGPCVAWDDPDPWWTRVDHATPRVRERIARGRANHGRRFLTQHVTGHPGVALAEPIRTITTKDQWAVVNGEWYRPLTIRENARAMGFPDSYRWPTVDPTTGRGVRRSDAIRGLGNAVPPPLAARVVARVGGLL
jgi:DNA (cytosine-5)-methyltransferase 1